MRLVQGNIDILLTPIGWIHTPFTAPAETLSNLLGPISPDG
jgi:hypothetical protein